MAITALLERENKEFRTETEGGSTSQGGLETLGVLGGTLKTPHQDIH